MAWSITCLIDTCETNPCQATPSECQCWCHAEEDQTMPKLTKESIRAIEQVLLVNADISALYEKRGVSRDDLREVFRLAEMSAEHSRKDRTS
jgi:hypothetical protein